MTGSCDGGALIVCAGLRSSSVGTRISVAHSATARISSSLRVKHIEPIAKASLVSATGHEEPDRVEALLELAAHELTPTARPETGLQRDEIGHLAVCGHFA
jgi:mRNA-degrading endonuclease toxin of MazEF toxin-antitoxin module